MSIQVLPDARGGLFQRLGRSFGEGLSEQIPQEVERHRLSSGLKELSQKKNLTPFEQFSELSSIPGVTPQMIQSGAELLRQQGVSNALVNKEKRTAKTSSPFPKKAEIKPMEEGKNAPSITTREPLEATLENFVPKSLEQLQVRAGELLEENPALYANNPEKAFSAAQTEDLQKQSINTALQQRRQNEINVQDRVKKGLEEQSKNVLEAEVPGNVSSAVEDKAINAIRPKNQGGEGLTEQQALKKYGKEMDTISRDYYALNSVGNWLIARSPAENKRELRNIRNKFKERDDLENLADSYIARNGLSPSKAYYLAYPSSDIKELNNQLAKIPKLRSTSIETSLIPKQEEKTLAIVPKIAKAMGKEGSPLSIAEELRERNYDPDIWLDYLSKNRKSLDLTERQGRELDKPRNFTPTLNDIYLFTFSGLDKLVEQ